MFAARLHPLSTRLAMAAREAARVVAPRLVAAVPSAPPLFALAPASAPSPLLLGAASLRRILLPAAAPSPLPQSRREALARDEEDVGAAAGGAAAQRAAAALLPPLTAALTLLPNLMPSIVMVGKKKHRGKNKRMPKAANHGARPCSHVMRRRRAAVIGRIKARMR